MSVVVIVVGIVLVVAVVAWFVASRRHPEDAAGHSAGPREGSDRFFSDTNDRPAGPGAEADGVAGPGEPMPGPSAVSPPERDT